MIETLHWLTTVTNYAKIGLQAVGELACCEDLYDCCLRQMNRVSDFVLHDMDIESIYRDNRVITVDAVDAVELYGLHSSVHGIESPAPAQLIPLHLCHNW